MGFAHWFESIAGVSPHPWQAELGESEVCADRLLRVPTGFGKTAGTVLPWLYHRAERKDARWPTRLVFCLPMRVLVEQTEAAIEEWIAKASLDVRVTTLLGGRHESGWLVEPEKPAVLVGTQDMLLSRALGRGYGSSRGLWPMEMGLVNNDALWVIDEIQLMDVGLATTTQLHAFRMADLDRGRMTFRPRVAWWMSATLQPSWLDSVDFVKRRAAMETTKIPRELRRQGLWEVTKALERRADAGTPEEVAAIVASAHHAGELTLVIVNTVDRARKVHQALAKKKVSAEARNPLRPQRCARPLPSSGKYVVRWRCASRRRVLCSARRGDHVARLLARGRAPARSSSASSRPASTHRSNAMNVLDQITGRARPPRARRVSVLRKQRSGDAGEPV